MPEVLQPSRTGPTPGLPRGPHSLTREQVAANQRQRLLEGMIDAIGEKGYAATTVSDVIRRAGVSRKAFYEHFANKEECFLATYDSIAAVGRRGVSRAFRRAEGLPDSVQAALGELIELAIARPQALRVLMVEIGAAGPAGIERREQLVVRYEDFLRESLGLPPGPGAIPNPILRGVVGGILHVIYTHLRRGERKQLRKRLPDLVNWATSYWPAPESILTLVDPTLRGTAPRLHRRAGRVGGLPAPFRSVPRPAGGDGCRAERMGCREASSCTASASGSSTRSPTWRRGAATHRSRSRGSPPMHRCRCRPSTNTSADKEDAFLVAYEIGQDKALALVERAYDAEHDWRYGVRAGLASLFDFLAGESAFAHMALIDVLAATERTSARAIKGAAPYAQMLHPDPAHTPDGARPPEVTVQAIAGGLFELMLHHALQHRMQELPVMVPRATFFALAPFVGAEAAGEVATAAFPLAQTPMVAAETHVVPAEQPVVAAEA